MKQKLLTFFTCMVAVFMAYALLSLAHAAPPEGKGKDKDTPAQSQAGGREEAPGQQDRTPPGQDRAADVVANRSERATEAVSNRAERSEAKAENRADSVDRGKPTEATVDRQHPHQERRAQAAADRADNASDHIHLAAAHGRGGEHRLRGRDAAKAHVDSLLKSLNKLEHARWDYNPHDTRGQGNMGKVDMRSPYGFDKDSGREGAERGRAIHPEPEPILDLASLVTVDFQIPDYQLWYYQYWLKWAQTLYDKYSYLVQFNSSYASKVDYFASQVKYYEEVIAAYYADPPPYLKVATNLDMYLNYTLNLGTEEGFDGTTLLVTTTLTSINDYISKGGLWSYDYATGTWKVEYITYDAGEMVMTQTQEVTLGQDSTYNFTYDPPNELVGSTWWDGGYFELVVTVTEPVSGATYTITYDRDIYLYRCPYGIVYDKTTSKPIVGATVTVHNADGSIVALDKASNPNVSNPQTTDATGRYNAKLAIGKKYYLSVKARGYEEYRSSLFSERWHIVREDVGLTPVKTPVAEAATPTLEAPASLGTETLGENLQPGLGISPTVLPRK